MLGTMQDTPLSVARLLEYGSTVHANQEVITWTGEGVTRVSYGEVGRRCARLAHALRGLGVTGDERVATFMWNNVEHLESYFAIPAMGAVVHTLNIRLFPEQLIHVVNHAEDHAIIVNPTLVPLLAPHLSAMPTVKHIIVTGNDASAVQAPDWMSVHSYEQLIADQPDVYEWPELDEHTAAGMCYTSGTTGEPKGVLYSHRSIWLHTMQLCMTDGMALRQGELSLAIVPQFHAMSWGLPYAAFMVGASLLMPDRFLQPAPLAEMIQTLKPTFAAAVPAIWQGLLLYLEDHDADITSLRNAVVGGSTVPPSLMHSYEEKHGVTVLHAWGMTETSPLASVAYSPADASDEEGWGYRYSQGRLPATITARIKDDDGNILPFDGVSIGEVQLRGPWVAASYYGIDTPEKFDDGWLCTGDVGKMSPDGYLTLTDRSKDIIKSGGEWISSVDMENAVMGHPDVLEAAVIGIPDEKWDERPLVAVALRQNSTVTTQELQDFLKDKVVKWQLPENWARVPEIPKTSVGKFDKKNLRGQFQNGVLVVEQLQAPSR